MTLSWCYRCDAPRCDCDSERERVESYIPAASVCEPFKCCTWGGGHPAELAKKFGSTVEQVETDRLDLCLATTGCVHPPSVKRQWVSAYHDRSGPIDPLKDPPSMTETMALWADEAMSDA